MRASQWLESLKSKQEIRRITMRDSTEESINTTIIETKIDEKK